MKKAIRFTTGLSLQIILLGAIGFFGTFLSDYLADMGWFGDTIEKSVHGDWNNEIWGARHRWYVVTLVLLVVIQIVRIVMWSVSFWDPKAKEVLN